MTIIKTVTENAFIDDLLADDYASWTYDEAAALYDYYWQLSEDLGEPMELDRVSIRCEWDRAESIDEVIANYDDINSLQDLSDNTCVIELEGGRLLFVAF